MHRKEFLKGIGVLGIGTSLSDKNISFLFGSKSPNEKVVVGVIGTHNRGIAHAKAFVKSPNAEVGYIADVDEQWMVKGIDAVKNSGQNRVPKGVKDFRRILDDKEVDAISIATPDHWHVPIAILALKAGKHVYIEKPSSHNAKEGFLLVEAAAKYGKKVQMGNQRRSWNLVKEAISKVKDGTIGEVYYARTWYNATRGLIGKGNLVPVPSTLDYDLWSGPAQKTRYRDNIIPYNWHWFWNWGTGELGNNGTHFLDLARWGLGVDYPTKVSSNGGKIGGHVNWETPDLQLTSYDFQEGKAILWEGRSGGGGKNLDDFLAGTHFFGTEGSILIAPGNSYRVYDSKGKMIKDINSDTQEKLNTTGPGLGLDEGHFGNFLNAIRKDMILNSPIDDAEKSTLLVHLGNIAYRTGKTLNIDPYKGVIMGDSDAIRFWGREYTPGWWVPTI